MDRIHYERDSGTEAFREDFMNTHLKNVSVEGRSPTLPIVLRMRTLGVQSTSAARSDFLNFMSFLVRVSIVGWAANLDNQVGIGATLNLTVAGELVLRDVDGSTVWTTNTIGKSVVGMNLTDDENVVLLDVYGKVVWHSFDYPTDILLPNQKLFQEQKLIPSVSLTSWTAQKGAYFFQVDNKAWFTAVESNPPQVYYHESYDIISSNENSHVSGLEYFRAVNNQQPDLGCSEITYLACNATLDQDFIELENIIYFNFIVDMVTVNKEA
ncbi:hypothetical protein OSB04_un000424 [Centaurea solstitialis]|uniref:Bulb-type lectin domain-containing protein n=1 Tax=Centaurea solstitialis TaxID=347529 RepID=A0AA38W3N0_9ASTR|nr:hypothetical protein OSB04_un000424 [Centaurea solstitialis]